jgi:hypothetical protein
MYHDQGLVAFKSLSFESGVNFTAGLPFVRTSPDHGTAYNITGQNKASADSFREALFMAMEIVSKRADYKEMYANPLNQVNIEDFVGAEEEAISLPEDSFEAFVPMTTSKYSKALMREAEDDLNEPISNKVQIVEEEIEEEDYDDTDVNDDSER